MIYIEISSNEFERAKRDIADALACRKGSINISRDWVRIPSCGQFWAIDPGHSVFIATDKITRETAEELFLLFGIKEYRFRDT